MPYKNKEDYNAYMRAYRSKKSGKPVNRKPKEQRIFEIPDVNHKPINPSIRFYAFVAEVIGVEKYWNLTKKQLIFEIYKKLSEEI